jgi:hypothetical protein
MNDPTKEDDIMLKLTAAALVATTALTFGLGAAFASSRTPVHRTVAATHPVRVSLSRETSRDATASRERSSLDRLSSRDRVTREHLSHSRSDSRHIERGDR